MNLLHEEKKHQLAERSILLLLLTAAILLWGLGAIYHTQALSGNWQHYLGRQFLWCVVACFGCGVMAAIPFSWLWKHVEIFGMAGLLWLLILPVFGISIHGMCGWFVWFGIAVQPSEITKGFFILWLVKILAGNDWPVKRKLGLAGMVTGSFCLLIACQPDFGTAGIYFVGALGCCFLCGVPFRWLIGMMLGAVVGSLGVLWKYSYMQERLWNFLHPVGNLADGGWHLHQLVVAVARGGWFGVKSDMAVWSASFLPLSHNDSVFAAMCELLGVCGAGLLLLFYGVWFWQWFMLAYWRKEPVRRMVIESLAVMIFVQCLLHVLVNLALIPPTGITLPLVSYGGSSMLGTLLMLGIAFSAVRE